MDQIIDLAQHTSFGRDGAPVAGAVLLDVGDEDEVLLRRPGALLDALLVAARRPHHGGVDQGPLSIDLREQKQLALFSPSP